MCLSAKQIIITQDTTWTVCSSGCTYNTVQDAWNAATSLHFLHGGSLNINIADGTYHIPVSLTTANPGMINTRIIGNTAHPENVVLEFDGVVSIAVVVANGGGLGGLFGVTLSRPMDGTGDLKSGDFSTLTSAVWSANTTAAVYDTDNGTITELENVVITGFANGVYVDRGSQLWSSGPLTIKNYGSWGIYVTTGGVAYFQGTSVGPGSTSTTIPIAVDVVSDGFVSMRGATITSAQIGVVAGEVSGAELNNTTISNCNTGIEADIKSGINATNLTIKSAADAILSLRASAIIGQTVTITGATRPVHAEHMGEVYLTDTLARITNSGSSYIAPNASANGYSWIGGSAFVN